MISCVNAVDIASCFSLILCVPFSLNLDLPVSRIWIREMVSHKYFDDNFTMYFLKHYRE